MFLGKKARTFDLEAMFEQTRRTAVERSRKVLGKELGGADALTHPKMRFAFFVRWGDERGDSDWLLRKRVSVVLQQKCSPKSFGDW